MGHMHHKKIFPLCLPVVRIIEKLSGCRSEGCYDWLEIARSKVGENAFLPRWRISGITSILVKFQKHNLASSHLFFPQKNRRSNVIRC
jgi:hypothetical protein